MADALVCHPHVGSVWLQNAEIRGDEVVGEVDDGVTFGHRMLATMHFPASCVRKWNPTHNDAESVAETGPDTGSSGAGS